jgi:hypothetical protein
MFLMAAPSAARSRLFAGLLALTIGLSAFGLTQEQRRNQGLQLTSSVLKPTMKDLLDKVGDFESPNPFVHHYSAGHYDSRTSIQALAIKLISLVRKHYPIHHVATLGRDGIFIADIFEALELRMHRGPGVTRLGASSGSISGAEQEFLQANGLLSLEGEPLKPFVAIDPTRWNTDSQLRSLIAGAYSYYSRQGRAQGLSQWVAGITSHAINTDSSRYLFDPGNLDPSSVASTLSSSGVPSSRVLNIDVGDLAYTSHAWHGPYGTFSRNAHRQFVNPNPGVASNSLVRESMLWMMYEIGAVIFEPHFLEQLAVNGKALYNWQNDEFFGKPFDPEVAKQTIQQLGLLGAYDQLHKNLVLFLDEDFRAFIDFGLEWLAINQDLNREADAVGWFLANDRARNVVRNLPPNAALTAALEHYQTRLSGLNPLQADQKRVLASYFGSPLLTEQQTLKTWKSFVTQLHSSRQVGDLGAVVKNSLYFLRMKTYTDAQLDEAFYLIYELLKKEQASLDEKFRFWQEVKTETQQQFGETARPTLVVKGHLIAIVTSMIKKGFADGAAGDTQFANVVYFATLVDDPSAPECLLQRTLIQQELIKRSENHSTDLAPFLEKFWGRRSLGLHEVTEKIFIDRLPESPTEVIKRYESLSSAFRSGNLENAVRARIRGRLKNMAEVARAREFLVDPRTQFLDPEANTLIKSIAASAVQNKPRVPALKEELNRFLTKNAPSDFDLLYFLHVIFDGLPITGSEDIHRVLQDFVQSRLPWASVVVRSPQRIIDPRQWVQTLRAEKATFDEVLEAVDLFYRISSRDSIPANREPLIQSYFQGQETLGLEIILQLINYAISLTTQFQQIEQIASMPAASHRDVISALFYPALNFAKDFQEAMQLLPKLPQEMRAAYYIAGLDHFPELGDQIYGSLTNNERLYGIKAEEILAQLDPATVFRGSWTAQKVLHLLALLNLNSEVGRRYARAAFKVLDTKDQPQLFAMNRFFNKYHLTHEWNEFRNQAYSIESNEIGRLPALARKVRRGFGWNGPVGNCQQALTREKE